MKRYLGAITTIIILILFVLYFINHTEDFEALKDVSMLHLAIIAILQIFTIFLNGVFIRVVITIFNKDIDYKESFYVSLISTIGNYFVPARGGAAIRAIYLKRKHKLPYTQFISSLSGNYVIVFLINSILGLISLTIIHLKDGKYSPALYFFFFVIFLVSLLMSLFTIPTELLKIFSKYSYTKKIVDLLNKVIIGWNELVKHRGVVIKLVSITILNFLALLVITYLEMDSLSISLSLYALILYVSLSGISLLASITPGSIGIKEAILVFSSAVIGISNIQVLQIATIDRGLLFIILGFSYFIVGLPSSKGRSNKQTDGK